MRPLPKLSRLSLRKRKNLHSDYASGNGIVKSAKSIHLTASAIMLFAGIAICLFRDSASPFVRFAAAACCILIGGADIFGYYSNDLFRLAFQFAFAFGSYSVLFGALLILMPEKLIPFLPYAIASYVILDGLQKVQIALEGRKFGIRKWFLILATSVVVVLLGYLSVFFMETERNLITGIAVAANGAENFWTTMYTVRIRTEKQA